MRDAQRRLTRQRLITAARQVFERDGYGGASIGDIAALAEVHRRTYYLHFKDKSEAFVAVLEEMHSLETEPYWRSLDAALADGRRVIVRECLRNFVRWWSDHGQIALAWHEAMLVDPVVARTWTLQMDRIAQGMSEFCSSLPEARRAEAGWRVGMLIIQLDQLCLRWITQGIIDVDQDDMLEQLTSLWLSSLSDLRDRRASARDSKNDGVHAAG